jgi:broad specificity phosphatase PhoE
MAPARIMFIRHAEKPVDGGDDGVTPKGHADPESLTPRGWQRAGALARFFQPLPAAGRDALLTPTVFLPRAPAPAARASARCRPLRRWSTG